MPRKRYSRWQEPDFFADLGPGDPGYRLRPGKTGFDPVETYAEYGRMIGLLLKAAVTGRVGPFPRISLFILGGLLLIFLPSFLGTLDLVVGRKWFWVEVTYATLGAFAGLVVWVTLRGIYRTIRSHRR